MNLHLIFAGASGAVSSDMQNHDLLQIRMGTESDALPLARFAAHAFSQAYAADNRPEDLSAHLAASFGIDEQTTELRDPSVVTLLAQQSQRLVGYAQIRRNTPPPCIEYQAAIELHRFYVDQSCHGKGVAQQLMRAAQDSARAFGGRHLWLSVWERNPRAITFYKKMGFTDTGSKDFFVGPDRQTDRVLVASL